MDLENDEEVEQLLKKIEENLKEKLSEKRYNHSIGVMKKAEELAKIYGENTNKAKLVGIAHDIAKEMSKEEKLEYVKNCNIEIDEIERNNTGLLHGKIGADICKKEYEFSKEMQDAIKYHTTGNIDMDILAKIIFVADKIEETRKYKNEKKENELKIAREMAVNDLEEAVLYLIDSSIEYTIQKKELIHPDSINTRNKIIINSRLKKV